MLQKVGADKEKNIRLVTHEKAKTLNHITEQALYLIRTQ